MKDLINEPQSSVKSPTKEDAKRESRFSGVKSPTKEDAKRESRFSGVIVQSKLTRSGNAA